jgi:hypothetical protein
MDWFNFRGTMTLREVTRTVIKLVEDASGCPVVVNEDRSLTTLAASRIARGANRIHSISFNSSALREPDYLILARERGSSCELHSFAFRNIGPAGASEAFRS